MVNLPATGVNGTKRGEFGEFALSLTKESRDLVVVNHVSPMPWPYFPSSWGVSACDGILSSQFSISGRIGQVPFSGVGILPGGSIVHMAQCVWLLGWPATTSNVLLPLDLALPRSAY